MTFMPNEYGAMPNDNTTDYASIAELTVVLYNYAK